jgi:purine-binding chemotaxis protein CheW
VADGSPLFAATRAGEAMDAILRRRAESLAAEQDVEAAADVLSILLFGVGEEWYAVAIEAVREIYNEYLVTPVPCVPSFILGVINIRGEILSVTDIRQLLRLAAADVESRAPVIVVENGRCSTALLVDGIGDIVDIPRGSIEPPVSTLDKSQTAFVAGSVYYDGRLIGLLNLDEVLAPIGVDS